MLVQVPGTPTKLHDWQVPLHAVLQQTPSTQWPLKHWEFPEQICPFTDRQCPAPSHDTCPVQVKGAVISGPAGIGAHAPEPSTLHAQHAGHAAVAQHTPSTQFPLTHWLPVVHPPSTISGVQAEARQ
jgi:hypothetical protein